MKEIFKWRDIKPGCIFVSRNQSLLGKAVAFWADGWSHCGIIYEEKGNFFTIEARKHVESRPLYVHYELWKRGDLRIFYPEVNCKEAINYALSKLGQHYDWLGDVALFFILPFEILLWRLNLKAILPKIIRTKREKCSENVLLYMRCIQENNPKDVVFKYLVDNPIDKDLCIPADITKICGEMCQLSKSILK